MEYLIHLSIITLIYAGLALSLSVLIGHAGILSISHAVWFGAGAYSTALALLSGHSFTVSALFAVCVSALGACVVSAILTNIDSGHFAICSFGVNVCIFTVLVQWTEVTGGAIGISNIPRPTLFGFTFTSNLSFLVLSVFSVVSIGILTWWITQSHFGRVLRAIRDDEQVLRVFHYNPRSFKILIYTITAGMAAVCGALYASYISFIDPSSFSLTESLFILTLIAVGGFGSLSGAVAGAAFVMLLPEALRFIGISNEAGAEWRLVIFGSLLLYIALYRPQGLFANKETISA